MRVNQKGATTERPSRLANKDVEIEIHRAETQGRGEPPVMATGGAKGTKQDLLFFVPVPWFVSS